MHCGKTAPCWSLMGDLQSSGNPKMLVCPSTFPSHHPSRRIPFLGLHTQRPGDLSASQPLLLAGSCVQGIGFGD